MLNIGVLGASGRMGRAILSITQESKTHQVVAGWSREPLECWSDIKTPEDVFERSQIVIDVSHATLLEKHISMAALHKKPLVVCTTGFEKKIEPLFEPYTDKTAFLYASNTSLGALVMRKALEVMSSYLPKAFDVTIVDRHHRHKKDAPSGTAMDCADTICRTRGEDPVFFKNGSYKPESIQMASFRCGDILGECDVSFVGSNERITIKHEVFHRNVFAIGALKAADFLVSQNPGFYVIDDVYRSL